MLALIFHNFCVYVTINMRNKLTMIFETTALLVTDSLSFGPASRLSLSRIFYLMGVWVTELEDINLKGKGTPLNG